MKGIFVILDGIGDLPHKLLKDQTPLEAAETPNLDFFATRGKLGYMYPVRQGFVPESDEAIVSIFGNDLISSSRGQLEARGADLKLTRGDLAFRANFATIDSYEKGNILDRRVGRTLTTSEAKELAKSINFIKMPVDFIFKPTIQHRAALVFKGGFSDNISGNDSAYIKGKLDKKDKIEPVKPFDDDENSVYTSALVNDFLEKIYEVLKNHPVNLQRIKRGLMPANFILIRGAGIEPPKLQKYNNWISLGYMPLEIGFSRSCGMRVYSFNYPKLKSLDSYENLHAGLRKACKYAIKMVKKNSKAYDYAYIHIKETDTPGHDNKPFEKKEMIEYIDKTLFRFLRSFLPSRGIKLVVTGDHSTPCSLKNHSAGPVPLLFYDQSFLKEKHFNEKEARRGELKGILGKDLFKIVGFKK